MGAQQVKNIAEPVQAFQVKLDGVPVKRMALVSPEPLPWAVVVVAIVLLAGGAWLTLRAPAHEAVIATKPAIGDGSPARRVALRQFERQRRARLPRRRITEVDYGTCAYWPLRYLPQCRFTYKGKASPDHKELGAISSKAARRAGETAHQRAIDRRHDRWSCLGRALRRRVVSVFALRTKCRVSPALRLHLVTGGGKAQSPEAQQWQPTKRFCGASTRTSQHARDIAKSGPSLSRLLPSIWYPAPPPSWLGSIGVTPLRNALAGDAQDKVNQYLEEAAKHPRNLLVSPATGLAAQI